MTALEENRDIEYGELPDEKQEIRTNNSLIPDAEAQSVNNGDDPATPPKEGFGKFGWFAIIGALAWAYGKFTTHDNRIAFDYAFAIMSILLTLFSGFFHMNAYLSKYVQEKQGWIPKGWKEAPIGVKVLEFEQGSFQAVTGVVAFWAYYINYNLDMMICLSYVWGLSMIMFGFGHFINSDTPALFGIAGQDVGYGVLLCCFAVLSKAPNDLNAQQMLEFIAASDLKIILGMLIVFSLAVWAFHPKKGPGSLWYKIKHWLFPNGNQMVAQ